MTKTENHPVLPFTITFNPATHTYTDQEATPYLPVTSFVSSFFRPFDEQAAAARVSDQSGSLEMSIIQQWREKAKASALYGTRVHQYAEARIRNQQPAAASSALEKRAFGIIDNAISMLSDTYEFISIEQIIFDPLFRIAGTVDIIARNRSTGSMAILDWKTCEEITDAAWGHALAPIAALRDSKLNHYALQLSVYAMMLSDSEYSGYPYRGEPTELALIHIPPDGQEPVWIPLPNLRRECAAMFEARDLSVKNEKARG